MYGKEKEREREGERNSVEVVSTLLESQKKPWYGVRNSPFAEALKVSVGWREKRKTINLIVVSRCLGVDDATDKNQ